MLEAKGWVPPLKVGMEVEEKIAVLGVIKGVEIVPPPYTDKIVCTLKALIVETMLATMVIEGKYRYGLGLEDLWVRVLMYNKTSR